MGRKCVQGVSVATGQKKRSKRRGNKLSKRLSKRRVKRKIGGWCDTEKKDIDELTKEKAKLEEEVMTWRGSYHRKESDYRSLRDSIQVIFDNPVDAANLVKGRTYVMRDAYRKYFLIKFLSLGHKAASEWGGGMSAPAVNFRYIKGQRKGNEESILESISTFYPPPT